MGARVVDVPTKGYGAALMGGILAANGKYIIMGDSDDSYDFSELQPFVDELRSGADLVMGNRFKGGIMPGAMPPLHRYIGNPVLSFLGRVFFNTHVRDFHCGLRGFNKESILALSLKTLGMEFASEMVVKASLARQKITEVPVILYPDGRDRPPHLNTWSDGWRHLRFLLLYSPDWLFLYPGIAITIIGVILLLSLIPRPLNIGGLNFDIDSMMVASLMILLGLQTLYFGLFSKVFAYNEGLLPKSTRLASFLSSIRLERGLMLGVFIILAGFLGLLSAVLYWKYYKWGGLNPQISMRITIPSITLIVCGAQIMFSSFFLSILGINKKG